MSRRRGIAFSFLILASSFQFPQVRVLALNR
jgi:hypothetical protein